MVQEPDLLVVTPVRFISSIFSGLVAKIVIAIIILLVGFIVAKIAGRFVRTMLFELEFWKKAKGHKTEWEGIIGWLVTYAIYLFSIILALNQLGLTAAVLYITATVMLFFVFISTILGVRDFFPNISARMSIPKEIRKGSIVNVAGIRGQVNRLGVFGAKIINQDGELFFVPNVLMKKSKLSQEG